MIDPSRAMHIETLEELLRDNDLFLEHEERAIRAAIEALRSSPVQERVIEQETETDHARSDQPQLRAGEADPRDDQGGGSIR